MWDLSHSTWAKAFILGATLLGACEASVADQGFASEDSKFLLDNFMATLPGTACAAMQSTLEGNAFDDRYAADIMHSAWFIGGAVSATATSIADGTGAVGGLDLVCDVHRSSCFFADYTGTSKDIRGGSVDAALGASLYTGLAFGMDHGVEDWTGYFGSGSVGGIPIPYLPLLSVAAGKFTTAIDQNQNGSIQDNEILNPPDGVYGFSVGLNLSASPKEKIQEMARSISWLDKLVEFSASSTIVSYATSTPHWSAANRFTEALFRVLESTFQVSFENQFGQACSCPRQPGALFSEEGDCADSPWSPGASANICRVRFIADDPNVPAVLSSTVRMIQGMCAAFPGMCAPGFSQQTDTFSMLKNCLFYPQQCTQSPMTPMSLYSLAVALVRIDAQRQGLAGESLQEVCPGIFETKEICDDGFDNDGDGDVDCIDSECRQSELCTCRDNWPQIDACTCQFDCWSFMEQTNGEPCPSGYFCDQTEGCMPKPLNEQYIPETCTLDAECGGHNAICHEGRCRLRIDLCGF